MVSKISWKINIFFSLALTPEDIHLYEEIRGRLVSLSRQGLIEIYSDNDISAGSDSDYIIKDRMDEAHIIVLLLSPDFSKSDRCSEMEMPYALECHTIKKASVIPVLLRPMMWEILPIKQFHLIPKNGKPVTTWRNRDTAFLEVAREIQRVADEIKSRLDDPDSQMKPPQPSLRSLPHPLNPFFTNREKILAKLHHFFTTEQTQQTRIQALYGMGGIGKTALVIKYANIHYKEYQTILWLDASSSDSLSTSILLKGKQLSISAYNELNEQQRFTAINEWLQHHDRWLVVLDNIEDFLMMYQFIPKYSHGHVLLTTQHQVTRGFASAISVDQMSVEDGALMLLRRAGCIDVQGLSDTASEEDIKYARKIAQEFTGYSLALDQAGAYIEESQLTLSSYFQLYQEYKATLLNRRGPLADDYPNPVTTTFSLTLKKINSIDPLALELLRLFAFLHSDALPDEMIRQGASALDSPLSGLALNSLAFNDVLTTLQKFSLVHRCSDTTTLNMHRIFQVLIKKDLTEQQQQQLAKQAVCLINSIFPDVLFEKWEECDRYMSQAQYGATLIRDFHLSLLEGGLLLERLGFYCYQRGIYSEAKTHLIQALLLYESNKDADILNIAQTLNSLGLLYRQQAHYKEAEAVHEHALELRKRALGQDDPKTMESQHNLAMIYGDLGKYQKAEHLFLSVLTIEEQAKGPDHTDVADTLSEIGLIYSQQGRFAEAEIAAHRALAIYEQARDANHPDLTYPLDTLGTIAEQRGDYQQAEALYQQAFEICLNAFGEEHPETAHSKNRLAGIAVLQGDYQDAENLYQQALNIDEQILGSNHPDVALILNDQALLATKQKQYKKAEPLYERALSIYELVLGPEHPDVASVLNNLGELARMTGNKKQAEELLKRSLAIREKIFDPTHPSIAQSLRNLEHLQNDK